MEGTKVKEKVEGRNRDTILSYKVGKGMVSDTTKRDLNIFKVIM